MYPIVSAALNRKLIQAEQRLRNGDASGALDLCGQVLRTAPRNPDALFLVGMARLSIGQIAEAVPVLEQALVADPRNGAALENLGLAHLMLGRYDAAEHTLRKASAMAGAPASVFMRLGIAILEQGRAADALAPLRRALALAPQNADVRLNLGRALAESGDFDAAGEQLHAVLQIAPRHADTTFNLGVLASQRGDFTQARQWFDRTLVISPEYVPAHERLASLCLSLGRTGEAITHLRALLKADPRNVDATATLANALFEIGDLDAARATAQQSIELAPHLAGGYGTLANIHLVHGALEAALDTLESGYARTAASGLLGVFAYQLRHACDWKRWAPVWDEISRRIETDAALGSPFWLLCQPTSAAQQLEYTRRWAAARFGAIPATARAATSARPAVSTQQRLKVGYLSSDLHEHATAYLIAEVLELHDRDRYEIFAYSYGPEDGSPMRRRVRDACEHFADIARESDDSAADRIRDDALDVLVDLKGYTLGDRVSILAYRPCAVQVTWLGYPGTTAVPFIDYAIADGFVVPPGSESGYTEKILRMPHCYQPNDRQRAVADRLDRPAYGLPPAGFVFCCFNQTYKITPEVFAVWLRLLEQVPGSVLWLLESNSLAVRNLRAVAMERGVAPERLVFGPRLPNAQHLARYRVADLALDTFPYTSHTTFSDALWCGCPGVALCGDTFASRVSGSLLTSTGLAELVTYSLVDYERLALRLASEPDLFEELRARVARARDASPLFDSAAFTRALEQLYADIARPVSP